MGKKHEGETKEEKEARKAAKAAKKASKEAPPPAPEPAPAPAAPAAKPKKEKKSKKAEKGDDGSGRIAELEAQVDGIEQEIAALKPGGSDRTTKSALDKILTQLDGVDAPAGSPARSDKRALQKRVEKLQYRATAAVKVVPDDDDDDDDDEPPAPSPKRRQQAPPKRVRKAPPANETQDEKIARIVEERVLDALEGRDAQIRMLKDQIRYIKKNGNKMMERKAQLKNMGGSGDRFSNMSSDGAIPTGY